MSKDDLLLEKIFAMSALEQENYFKALDVAQLNYIQDLLQEKARPKPTCDIFDNKAPFTEWITSHFYVSTHPA